MNCFQFDYFCGYHTANVQNGICFYKLWIAFNLITFVDITQRGYRPESLETRCELLSIWLLLWISHSSTTDLSKCFNVVNCFQFDYFCGYHTAQTNEAQKETPLWIAFNLITFVDITQHDVTEGGGGSCCELLSIWLLLWISHSLWEAFDKMDTVVNCFQFDYFCGYHTAFFLFFKLF